MHRHFDSDSRPHMSKLAKTASFHDNWSGALLAVRYSAKRRDGLAVIHDKSISSTLQNEAKAPSIRFAKKPGFTKIFGCTTAQRPPHSPLCGSGSALHWVPEPPLRQQLLQHMPMHIRQAEVAPLEPKREHLVLNAEQVQQRGVYIVHMRTILDRIKA